MRSAKMAALIAAGTRPLAAKKFLEFYALQCENDTIKNQEMSDIVSYFSGKLHHRLIHCRATNLISVHPTVWGRSSFRKFMYEHVS